MAEVFQTVQGATHSRCRPRAGQTSSEHPAARRITLADAADRRRFAPQNTKAASGRSRAVIDCTAGEKNSYFCVVFAQSSRGVGLPAGVRSRGDDDKR